MLVVSCGVMRKRLGMVTVRVTEGCLAMPLKYSKVKVEVEGVCSAALYLFTFP